MSSVAIVYTDDNGQEWTYRKGDSRIRSEYGEEINIWDHATASPGIKFNPNAVQRRVDRWNKESEE